MTTQHVRLNLNAAHGGSDNGLLRLALKLDAVASGTLGLLSAGAAPVLEPLLGVPATFLLPLGLFLVAYAAAVWLTGTRSRVHRTAVRAIIVLNLLWAAESIALVPAGWLPLTTPGVAFVLAQAGAVTLFDHLQFLGLRRARQETGQAAQA